MNHDEKMFKIFEGPLAVVRTCRCCKHFEVVRKGLRGVGRGYGMREGNKAKARDLYTGQMFKNTVRAAELSIASDDEPARLLILSARYGLVDPETVLEPYEQVIDGPGAVTEEVLARQAQDHGIDWDTNVYALLPIKYLRRLDNALRSFDCFTHDVYEANRGIGDQRHINACISA